MRYTPTNEQAAYLKRIGVPEFGGALPRPVLRPVVMIDPPVNAVRPSPAPRVPKSSPTPPRRHRPASSDPLAPFAGWLRKWLGGLF